MNNSFLSNIGKVIQNKGVSPTPDAPAPNLPYGALDVTPQGLPYYGDGFQGWVRKAWSDLTDPNKFLQDQYRIPEERFGDIKTQYEADKSRIASSLESTLKWSKWGEDFFGLSAEELASAPAGFTAEQSIAEEQGASKVLTGAARVARLALDTTQNLIWGGLEILGFDDTIMRKIHATAIGLDAVADRYNQDQADTWYKKLYSSNPISVTKDLLTVAVAVAKDQTTWGQVWDETKKYRAGSDMAYSMIWDEMARAEFERGIAEGKDPGFLAQSLGSAGTELAGSILGSPSTYLGLALKAPLNPLKNLAMQGADSVTLFSKTFNVPWRTVAKIPTFGAVVFELTGGRVAIGATNKIRQSLDVFQDVAVPGLEEILKGADSVEGSLRAETAIADATLLIKNKVDDMRRAPGFSLFSLDSSSKADVLSKQGGLFINSIVQRYGPDMALRIMNDMVALRGGGEDSVLAAARLLGQDYNRLFFSTAGMTTGEILSRMANTDIAKLVEKHAGEPRTLAVELTKKLDNITQAIIPSVDEMYKAKNAVDEAKRTGAILPEKTLELAKKYEEVPWVIRQVTKATKIPKAVTNVTNRSMAFMYMDLSPRYFVRNIYGQSLMTALHVGWGTAISTAVEAFKAVVPGTGKALVSSHINTAEEMLFKRLGMYSSRAAAGIGKATGNSGVAFLKSAAGAEQIYSSNIVLKAATDEVLKALPAVTEMPEWKALTASLPKEQQPLLYHALKRSYGNFDEAVSLFRKWTGSGEIEAWRLIEPPPALKKALEDMGLLDKFQDLQDSARNTDEFQQVIKDFTKQYKDDVTREAAKLPWVASGRGNEDIALIAQDLVREGSRRENEVITGLIQAHDNTYNQLQDVQRSVVERAQKMFEDLYAQTGDRSLLDRLHKIENDMNIQFSKKRDAKLSMNTLRAEINRFKNELQNASISELKVMWNEDIKFGDEKIFKLSDYYPDVMPKTPDEFRKFMWPAFFDQEASIYEAVNTQTFENVFGKLEEIAKLADSKVEDMAGAIKGDENPFFILAKYRNEAMKLEELRAQMRFFRQIGDFPEGTMLSQVSGKFDFKGWEGNKSHIVNAVGKPYEEITLKEAHRAISSRVVVPPYAGELPNEARVRWEGLDNFVKDVQRYSDKVVAEWGVKVPTVPAKVEEGLKTLKAAYEPRISKVRSEALIIAEATRDFILHDYNKTYADHALTYLLGNSFHYWSTRTYQKALYTLLENPQYANEYMAYKEYVQKRHSELPEFWRNQVNISSMFGIDSSNPYYVNLEAAINPTYGITGVDFNDPRKRVDAVSRMVDDLNKMGPTFSPLISWTIAMHLYSKGEQEASQRWMGRLFPQSAVIKSGTAAIDDILGKFGINVDTSAVEIDPFVRMLDGNVDPYERNRVAAAMAIMVQNGVINPVTGRPVTPEDMIDASRLKEGQLWDAAVEYSADQRFMSDASSFFLGSALRPRTENDVMMDQFWSEYNVLVGSRNLMSADDYRQSWDDMRQKYAFMDAVLISRKAGVEQDTALAYNVISRVPPGQMGDIAEIVGIEPYMLEAFYEAKGDFRKMGLNPQDQTRFMQGIIDLSLMLEMPNGATREEWGMARSEYSQMNEFLKSRYGEDIQGRINEFYDTEESQKDVFLEKNPDIKQALDERTAYINRTPILAAYYGGLSSIERYYTNQVYNTLDNEFGDMREKIQTYEELLITNPREARKFKKQYLDAYYDRRSELYKTADQNILNEAVNLPDTMPYAIRPEFLAESGIQEDAYSFTQEQGPQWSDFQQVLSTPLQDVVIQHFETGSPIPYSASNQLEKIANDMNMTEFELLRQIGMSLQNPTNNPFLDTIGEAIQ